MKNRKKMIPHKKDIQNFFMLKMAKEKFGNFFIAQNGKETFSIFFIAEKEAKIDFIENGSIFALNFQKMLQKCMIFSKFELISVYFSSIFNEETKIDLFRN